MNCYSNINENKKLLKYNKNVKLVLKFKKKLLKNSMKIKKQITHCIFVLVNNWITLCT